MYLEDFFAMVIAVGIMLLVVFGLLSVIDAEDSSYMCVTVNTKAHVVTWQEKYVHSYFGAGFGRPDKTTYPQQGTAKYEDGKSLGFNKDVPDVAVNLIEGLLDRNEVKGQPSVIASCA